MKQLDQLIFLKKMMDNNDDINDFSIKEYKDELETHTNKCIFLENTLQEKYKIIKGLEKQIKDHDEIIYMYEKELEEKDNKIKSLQKEIYDKDIIIREYENIIEEKDRTMDGIIKNQDYSIKLLEKKLEEIDFLNHTKKNYISNAQKMLQTNLNLEKEIIEIDLVIKELEDNLENKLVTIKDFEKNMNEKKESIE